MTPDIWVTSWSVAIGLTLVVAVRVAVTMDVTCQPFGLWANEDFGEAAVSRSGLLFWVGSSSWCLGADLEF